MLTRTPPSACSVGEEWAAASCWEAGEERGCWAVPGTGHAFSCPLTGLRAQESLLQLVQGESNYHTEQRMARQFLQAQALALALRTLLTFLPGAGCAGVGCDTEAPLAFLGVVCLVPPPFSRNLGGKN